MSTLGTVAEAAGSLGSRPSPYVRVLIARPCAISSSFDLPAPAQLKRARKGKAWNRGRGRYV